MKTTTVTEWVGHHPANTVAKRVQWRRESRGGRVEYGVRGYKGVATRQVRTEVDGRVTRRVSQYERCGCFHTKRSAAVKCGKWLAGRLNARPDLVEPKNRVCSCMPGDDGAVEVPSGSCPKHGWMINDSEETP